MTAVAWPSWKRPPMVGSPRPTTLTSPFERAAGVDLPARVDAGGDLEDRLEHVDGRGGREELHVRRRRERHVRVALGDDAPLSSSTTWMLASELRATVPLTSEASRSSNVAPDRHDGADRLRRGLAAAWPPASFGRGLLLLGLGRGGESRSAMRRTARIATGRAPGNVIGPKDTFPRGGTVQSWCYGFLEGRAQRAEGRREDPSRREPVRAFLLPSALCPLPSRFVGTAPAAPAGPARATKRATSAGCRRGSLRASSGGRSG